MPKTDVREKLNNASNPSYKNLTESLRSRVREGHWPAGGMLPSRAALAREHGVSMTTVQLAISRLIGEGILYADGGRGTFVARSERPVGNTIEIPTTPLRPLLSNPILGIVDNASLYKPGLRSDDYGWIDVIATHLETAFEKAGGRTHYFDPPSGSKEIARQVAIDALLKEGVDAIAIIGVFDDADVAASLPSVIDWRRTPTVYLSSFDLPFMFPHVVYDNHLAGYEAAKHLRQCGYGPLTFFGHDGKPWSQQRLGGVREAVPGEDVQVFTLYAEERSDRNLRTETLKPYLDLVLENASQFPTMRPGIIADTDLLASELQELAQARGCVTGQDFGLIGFDNHPHARARGLTTMRPPLGGLGDAGAQMLLNHLRGDSSCIQTRLRSQLLPRGSTRRS